MNIEAMIEESRTRLQQWFAEQKTKQQQSYVSFEVKNHEQYTYDWYRRHFKGERFVCVCMRCGSLASSAYHEPYKSRIESSGLCFQCVHWDSQADSYDFTSHKRMIIEGWPYSDSGNRPKATPQDKSMMGFGGRVFTITHLQDGRTWQTNNLYGGSPILQYWRHRMPDNAVFGEQVPIDLYR